MAEYGGSTFANGLYRLHTPDSGVLANRAVAQAQPDLDGQAECFGYDWLGRQFAVDVRAPVAESVRMIEPGTGEVLTIPVSFVDFHNAELLSYRDAALASSLFESWATKNPNAIPLNPDRCVGYRVPLFLGGRDEPDNLEETDLWIYWSICTQLLTQVRALPPGARIHDVQPE